MAFGSANLHYLHIFFLCLDDAVSFFGFKRVYIYRMKIS